MSERDRPQVSRASCGKDENLIYSFESLASDEVACTHEKSKLAAGEEQVCDVCVPHKSGFFITFEGTDGVGKSTQITQAQQYLEERGFEVLVVREPGCTKVGEQIREILLSPLTTHLSSRAELLLYEAARAQLVDEVIKPALERGVVVLADRFFDSTVAYQGYGRNLPIDLIDELNLFATDTIVPDLTLWLNNDAQQALKRAALSNGNPDRLEREGASFMCCVQDGFTFIAKRDGHRVKRIDAQGSIETVSLRIQAEIDTLLSRRKGDFGHE